MALATATIRAVDRRACPRSGTGGAVRFALTLRHTPTVLTHNRASMLWGKHCSFSYEAICLGVCIATGAAHGRRREEARS